MNPDNQLLIGIVLIAIGGLIGVLAYTILSDRSRAENEKVEEPEEPTTDKAVAMGENADDHPEESETQGDPTTAPDPTPSDKSEIDEETALEIDDPSDDESQPVDMEEQTTTVIDEGVSADHEQVEAIGERIHVASLLRDETTGELIVKVDDREYLTSETLRESSDWTRVEYAAADLAKWLTGITGVTRHPEEETEEPALHSKSMIEQINEILQRKLMDAPGKLKAIRLIEGPDGSVRVLIGVNSYAIDEVPDPEASKQIREAVATWEGRQ
ncbi:MAG: hypothetical protein GTO14_23765 [Anaerolineales bacterium]|nr:hypothetical protein [Anaerolineales bacterium]